MHMVNLSDIGTQTKQCTLILVFMVYLLKHCKTAAKNSHKIITILFVKKSLNIKMYINTRTGNKFVTEKHQRNMLPLIGRVDHRKSPESVRYFKLHVTGVVHVVSTIPQIG